MSKAGSTTSTPSGPLTPHHLNLDNISIASEQISIKNAQNNKKCCCSCCEKNKFLSKIFKKFLKSGKKKNKIGHFDSLADFIDELGRELDKILLTHDIDKYEKVLKNYQDQAIAYGLDSSSYEGILHPHWDRLKLWRKVEQNAKNLHSLGIMASFDQANPNSDFLDNFENLVDLLKVKYPDLTSVILRKIRKDLEKSIDKQNLEVEKIEKILKEAMAAGRILSLEELEKFKDILDNISSLVCPKRDAVLQMVEKMMAEVGIAKYRKFLQR